MSDFYTIYLSLDCAEYDATSRVQAVRTLLLESGYKDYSATTGAGVEYSDSWRIVDAGGNTGQPVCPDCRSINAAALETVGDWYSTREEPAVLCSGCGGVALLGDWFGPDGAFGVFGCHASVTVWNSHIDSADLLWSVMTSLGSRTREVRGRL